MNQSRRSFLKKTAISAAGFPLISTPLYSQSPKTHFKSNRPSLKKRNFTSKAVEETIKEIKTYMADKELAWMFENCFPNTLDTTVTFTKKDGKPDTFVITGDIDAMWLRDSTAQVWPYLPLMEKDSHLKELIAGVINRHTQCILIDPYANAFNHGPSGSKWESDITDMKPELHERKWEIDSLCYSIRLAHEYWKKTKDTSVFDEEWHEAIRKIYQTFREQQRKENPGPYKFSRSTSKAEDTVPHLGMGNPVKPVGLICSIFRPSDDATIYPFLIPSNLFAIVSLRQAAEILQKIIKDTNLAQACRLLANEVEQAIRQYAISNHQNFGAIFAFEVDGYGNKLYMDDSNVPSLLSLPYLQAVKTTDTVYQNTRRFVLSSSNPYFFQGKAAEGIGGPHVGMDYIWPMSITMRALTSQNDNEIRHCLGMLKRTHAGTGFMHEGFHKDNPEKFTREWFAWANTLFGELILKIYHERPHILKEIL